MTSSNNQENEGPSFAWESSPGENFKKPKHTPGGVNLLSKHAERVEFWVSG